MTQIGTVETPTARKAYHCDWCGERIERGEKYTRWTWTDGGKLSAVRVHPECDAAWCTLHPDDADSVGYASCCRGCTCERGNCECGRHSKRSD